MTTYKVSVPSPDEISALELPDSATHILSEYDQRIGYRPDFLWKWLYEVFPRYRLSSVPSQYHETVREQKLLLTIFYTLLDDLADLHGDRATFMEARKLPLPRTTVDADAPGVDADYLALTELAWEMVESTLRSAPRAGEFWLAFEFDLEQVLNAMHHSCLVTEMPPLVTESGTEAYNEHNMAQFSYADIDILFSPSFDTADLRQLREVVWRAQRLARISNWVATWEREIEEGDPTSGVVVCALTEGVITLAELEDPDVSRETLVERIRAHDIEEAFLEEWDRLYDQLVDQCYDTDSVDLCDYVTGMKEMRDLYLAYRDTL